MDDAQAKLERNMSRIAEAIDRTSSVSTSVQLRGAIEFGIASGDLPAGTRLPSVRRLAGRVGISPVTVSNVYAKLRESGFIEGRIGSGTFVSGANFPVSAARVLELDRHIEELVGLGRDCGLSPSDLAARIAVFQPRKRRHLRLLMLGNFQEATEAYAEALRPELAEGDDIRVAILSEISQAPPRDIDMVVAPRTLLRAAEECFPDTPIIGLTLIPDKATRVALASLPTDARVVGYSYFPGFVTMMKTGITRFAPHLPDVTMAVRGEPGAEAAIAQATVIVYASGADYLNARLGPGQIAFEYRHTPDNQAVRRELLPAIEACRFGLVQEKGIPA